ncbi:MAG: DUF1870 family protein [Alphaproteobacteria bacterium]|nr:MAG: DUF1870 family protein [Alphaproteobacteria bacterium]
MLPAQFRTLREGLGLSEKDIAMLTLVPEATLKMWEQGVEPIPEGVAGLVADIEREIAARTERGLKAAAARDSVTLIRFKNAFDFRKHGPDMVPIPAMLAFKCHCALVARLYQRLVAEGRQVAVRYHG